MSAVLDILLPGSFCVAGLSFLVTAVSAAQAFSMTKGRFNRHLSYGDIHNAATYSVSAPVHLLLNRRVAARRLHTHLPLAYSYIGLFLSFVTSVFGVIIWVIFYRDMHEIGIAAPLLICWYISLVIKNIGINSFHLRVIAAQLALEDL